MEGMIPVINKEEYWMFRVKDMEWVYVLGKYAKAVEPAKGDVHVASGQDGAGPLYFMKRSYFGPEVISKMTGLSMEKLATIKGPIKLSIKPEDGLPIPTVDYWGEA